MVPSRWDPTKMRYRFGRLAPNSSATSNPLPLLIRRRSINTEGRRPVFFGKQKKSVLFLYNLAIMVNRTLPVFPEEGLKFLRSLERNNNRDWFNQRKSVYE